MGFLISIFLAFQLRRFILLEGNAVEKWDELLKKILIFSVILLVASSGLKKQFPLFIAGYALLFWLCRKVYTLPEFAGTRSLMFSIAPLGIVYFFDDSARFFLSGYYDNLEDYVQYGRGAGWVWFTATFISFQKQQKALKAERALRQKESKESQLVAARKAVLELLVQERTSELRGQNEKLQQALNELNAAQAQLIHSEKMASLGELTAGIAHEIQNPLNFINNFSELNAELADELKHALEADDKEEAFSIIEDIKSNQLKVVHHGKRADSIVKSMLQHSRGSGDTREAVNLNELADECIRLSYHGMRAKEKSFNAKMETRFAENVGLVELVPGEISRVLLNICTNAFYAVMQKSKLHMEGYAPTVVIETEAEEDKVRIKIKDNGGGIPKESMEKIFQPFFTTKPTGEGTGLGLSMSFDIIKKGHKGDIRVESEEGQGATFIIELPKK
jgi:signal transduction histidine kinase